MTDGRNNGAGGGWEPLPQGEYDADATAFVQIPQGEYDVDAVGTPLAAPGHGYVPPQITVAPTAADATDPAATGVWVLPPEVTGAAPAPGGTQTVSWPDPSARLGHGGHDAYEQPGHDPHHAHHPYGEPAEGAYDGPTADGPYDGPATDGPYDGPAADGPYDGRPAEHPYGGRPVHDAYDPRATGQWTFPDAASPEQPPAGGGQALGGGHAPAAHDVTGQWSIPVADGDLPDESGEFATSSLAAQWGGTPPATLPGGAPAPWATSWPAQAPEAPLDQAPEAPAGPEEAPGVPEAAAGQGTAERASVEETPFERTAKLFVVAQRPDGSIGPARDVPEEAAQPQPLEAPEPPHAPEPPPAHEATSAPEPHAAHEPPATPEQPDQPGQALQPQHVADGYTPEFVPVEAEAAAPEETVLPQEHADAEAPPEEPEEATAAAEPAPTADAGPQPDAAPKAPAAPVAAPEPESQAAPDPEPVPDEEPDAATEPQPPADAEPDAEPDPEEAQQEAEPVAHHDEHPLVSYVLRVNGSDRPVTDAWIGESLLYVLRERLGLAGAKDGCSQGECGACNVQVDGRLVASCLVPAATTAGSEVRTVEGLAADGRPSDVQRALANCGAVQCGFCVPGMAMTLHDLLEGNPAPSDLETRRALCGNLCRCSGYRGVLDAVRDVVAERAAQGAAEQEQDEQAAAGEARVPRQAGPYGQDGEQV
ncbi:hypothetical protein GCM10018785_71920 [Streptomyces longispororuber]|uniref:2Fe-2S ferredoxin-type domain-containing protein n=1 Tax=Streptomyces longispororuber TaxID=68230 RepID=A0A919ABZ5_9ACTN|nr:2Fe-2S iron-sulfur cluster-binding protein [Streptomyces longispororuber]GHE96793.1 hypothetical protein GCM10018785_71920 [Streptomyces longispororuber]